MIPTKLKQLIAIVGVILPSQRFPNDKIYMELKGLQSTFLGYFLSNQFISSARQNVCFDIEYSFCNHQQSQIVLK